MVNFGIKNIVQRLNFFKEYSSLLLPIVIAVVAGLLFIPSQLLSSRLKKQIASESVSVGKKVNSLIANTFSRDQWKQEAQYQQAYAEDANQVSLWVKQTSQRELLSYKIFPEPKDVSTLIFEEFGQRFRNGVEKLIAGVNGHDCPSQAELERTVSSTQFFGERGASAQSYSETGVNETIRDALCRARAESSSVYISPTNLSGYEFWEKYGYTGIDEAVKDCWYWQLGYWIIGDVIDTIHAMNDGSTSVFTSPVKRLLGISFAAGVERGGRAEERRGGKPPHYVLTPADGLTESCTGRLSDNETDVFHFSISVVVDTKAVLPFMQQLCSVKQHRFKGFSGKEPEQIFKHNQITILESSVGPIDRKSSLHGLYRYGDDNVVRLDLICEYIFNKEGYDAIKPPSIKGSSGAAPAGGL
jgi:hypothetical protein